LYQSLADLCNGLARVLKDLGGRVLRFEDCFVQPQESGYRDILMNVRMSNGHIAEFRLHLESVDVVAGTEHALYAVRRGFEPIAKEQKRAVSPEEHALDVAAQQETQRLFWEAIQKALKPTP
jgi:hypothetical protein